MVCGFFAVLMLHFNGTGDLHGTKPALNLLDSNENSAVHFSDGAQETENHLAAVTFDWTNHTGFKSSIGSHFGPGPSTNFSN
jgi:hypothetical protein